MGLPGIQLLAQKPILMGPSRVGPPIHPYAFFFSVLGKSDGTMDMVNSNPSWISLLRGKFCMSSCRLELFGLPEVFASFVWRNYHMSKVL